MSDDRTQAPTKRRRQLAREHGQAAHSPELTAAAGLLGAAAALAWRGDALAAALLGLVRQPLLGAPVLSVEADEVVAHLRASAMAVAGPLGLVLAAFLLAALMVHQAQVQGLWAPSLLAPDPSRLWTPGRGPGSASRVARGLWSLVKAVVVAAVAGWVLRADWSRLQLLGGLDTPDLARASGQALRHLVLTLAAATLALGAIDFGLQYRRFEAMLRLTPEQQREDMRSTEGDPVMRSRRRRAAQAMREGPAELLEGSSLVLSGSAGLTVVLAGGPPPRHISIRAIVSGTTGERLRRDAGTARLPIVAAPDLARRLARRRPQSLPPTPELRDELALIWPAPAAPRGGT